MGSFIINTAATVEHESVLGDGVHVAPGATVAGCVTVGSYSMIGVGAVVLPRVVIGSNTIIGAGAVVTRDIPDRKVAYGNPARIQREND
jgi:acetyltransferase-like isoleucine patch superfamily enzyme